MTPLWHLLIFVLHLLPFLLSSFSLQLHQLPKVIQVFKNIERVIRSKPRGVHKRGTKPHTPHEHYQPGQPWLQVMSAAHVCIPVMAPAQHVSLLFCVSVDLVVGIVGRRLFLSVHRWLFTWVSCWWIRLGRVASLRGISLVRWWHGLCGIRSWLLGWIGLGLGL